MISNHFLFNTATTFKGGLQLGFPGMELIDYFFHKRREDENMPSHLSKL